MQLIHFRYLTPILNPSCQLAKYKDTKATKYKEFGDLLASAEEFCRIAEMQRRVKAEVS
jgi:hypothetical protein